MEGFMKASSRLHQGFMGKGHRQWTNCREHSPKTSISGCENGCQNTYKQVEGELYFLHPLSHENDTFAFQPPLPLTKKPTTELISPKTPFASICCPRPTQENQVSAK